MGPVWPLLMLPLLLRPQGACALPRYRTAEENHELFTSRKDTFEDEEQYLPASDHSSCFMCYATIASEMEGADQLFLSEHQLILWIYDPESADASELNHTAVFPSEVLNKLLWILGQKPADQNYFKQKTCCSERLPKFRFWVANIPEISDDIIIKITGIFQECLVQSTSFIIPRPKQSFPSKENDISLCSFQNSELSIKCSACFPTTAVLLSNFGTFCTNDAFKTHIKIEVLSDILTQGLNNNVTVVALSDNGISFLINSTCYKREARRVFILGAEHKLPESEILGVHSRYWCSTAYPVQMGKQSSTLAAQRSSEVYVGYNEAFNKVADTAILVKILKFPNSACLTVTTVSCDSVPSEVTMLLVRNACSSSGLFLLAFDNEDKQLWGLGDFYFPVPHSSAMRMIYINSALPPGLLWDDVFTAPIKTAQIMDIFMCLDQHYQKCQMAALSTRLFLEFKFSRQTDYILESNYTQALELTGGVMSAELKPSIENACKLQHEASFLSEAQSWHMMLKESKNSTMDDIWGPQNYRSCFELLENSSKEGPNEQYQALNSTSQNHITWPFSHDATRVFRVRISDRNYRSDVYMAKLYSFITLSIMLVCTTFWCTYSLTWKPETLGGFPQSSDKT